MDLGAVIWMGVAIIGLVVALKDDATVTVPVRGTILMPHSPSAVTDLYVQLRNAITVGNLTATSARYRCRGRKEKAG